MNKSQHEKIQIELKDYLEKIPKSIILDFIIRDALASGRDLSDILNIRSQVPNIMNSVDPKLTEGDSFMSKYTEEQRIKDLESIRTSRNGHIIDAAIKSGQVAGHAALETIKGNYHLTDEEAAEIDSAVMIEEAHRLIARRNGNMPQARDRNNQRQPYMSDRERIDAIVTAVNWD
ncbi:hypothetical protein [Paenibacillus sp. HW567]|uniref:hypothetical protein n=1 Tax=Paenibacillus sp. HW567 TaxID=1034769 RepID=UPI00035DA8CA|nr:hypothetical protein [Paenibacillus sp. HW567]